MAHLLEQDCVTGDWGWAAGAEDPVQDEEP